MVFALKRGIMAPKGTPPDVIAHWSEVFRKAADDPELLAQMDAKGTGVSHQGPEEFRRWAGQTYSDYEKVAIKIGMYKK